MLLVVAKSRKNRWTIATGGAANVTLRYQVYSREMTVRNNWVEAGFAMLNGAPTFITLVELAARPHEVTVELPAAWKGVQTPLMPVAGSPNTFRADDFDTIVDSPIIIGNPVVREFTVDGKKHALVLEGDPSLFDADKAAADVQKIVHGYFHNWNVKRLRPVELGPFDYENENYVKTLWVAEGFTDYYSEVLVKRAAISTRAEFLDGLSDSIQAVQTTPGRLVTPVNMASYDTWIKQYRPDENTANVSVNCYPKGAVIAFLLDAKIRKGTSGARSLDTGLGITSVRRGTPAIAAGLNVDDEILAIDDVRVRADGLAARMDQYKVGDTVSVLVARRDRVTKIDVTLGAEPGRAWRLEVLPTATDEQKARFTAWAGQ